jgi:hypothetical protein
MRNNQFGTTQNKKPYDRLQNFASQQSNVLSVAKQEFAQYPEPLIGKVCFKHLIILNFIFFSILYL